MYTDAKTRNVKGVDVHVTNDGLCKKDTNMYTDAKTRNVKGVDVHVTNDGLCKKDTNMYTDAKTRNVKGVEVVHVTNGINTERVMKGSVNVAKGSEDINDLNVNKSPGGESGDIDLNHGEESQ
eukprot:1078600_1